jgi:gliding motility-associated-like protein
VECVGNAALIDNGGDTLLLFEHNPELRIKGLEGEVVVYHYPDSSKIAFEVNDVAVYNQFDVEHGQGYLLKKGNVRECFWVFDNDSLRIQSISLQANTTCDQTLLELVGTIPQMQYTTQLGRRKNYPRSCRVSYLDAKWNNESGTWDESLITEKVELQPTLAFPASPVPTDYTLSDMLGDLLYIEADSLVSSIVDPFAVRANPTTKTTTRPDDKSNEVERPTTESTLSGSAPLNIEFMANPLNADYIEWIICKENEKLLTRKEAQHRYVFEEPGKYHVKMIASNTLGCITDTIIIDVAVSESMLEVPNTFTPNGDGAYDEFRVIYRSLKEFHIWIYNRWGHLVYESNDPAKGWDGNIGGRPAAEGAYYYVIRALGTDATEGYISKIQYSNEQKEGNTPPNKGPEVTYMGVYQLSGAVNLIRGRKL